MAISAVPGQPAEADNGPYLWETTVAAAGPRGAVSFFGDSVGIGAERFAPTLTDHLAAQGWGPIRFRAVAGGRTGLAPGWGDHVNATATIAGWRAEGWDSEHWIVNLGANDSGYCGTDLACSRQAIMLVVDAIGPGHRIWWPMTTRYEGPTFAAQEATWNLALTQIADERDDVFTWDWPHELRSRPDVYDSWDGTHLTPDGYRERSLRMANAFTDAVGRSQRVGPDAPLPEALGAPLALRPIVPTRAFDSRASGPPLPAGSTAVVDLRSQLPASAAGAVVNVTAAAPAAPGHLTVFTCGEPRPPSSTVNYRAGARAGAAFVRLAEDGTVCVFTHADAHVVVDVQAALVPAGTPGGLLMQPVTPVRLADTRLSGRATTVQVAVPGHHDLVAVNLTATGAEAPGHLTAHACGSAVPLVSHVNFASGDTVAGAALVEAGPAGVCVTASAPVDVVVDLTAGFAAGGTLAYQPVNSTRMLDTRAGIGGWLGRTGPGQTLDVGVGAPGAAAVTGTVTLVAPSAGSFLSVGPEGPMPHSSVNAAPGAVVANLVTSSSPAGRVVVFARAPGHVVLDVTGWWVPV